MIVRDLRSAVAAPDAKEQEPGALRRPGRGLLLLVALAVELSAASIVVGSIAASRGSGDLRRVGIFYRLLALDAPAAVLAIAILLAGLAAAYFVPDQPIDRVLAWISDHPIAIVAPTFALLAAGAVLGYHAYPLSADEYAPLFQAQAFAAGRLTGQFPPGWLDWLLPRPFNGAFFAASDRTGQIISTYWPGFALLLTPFVWCGAPWLLNPAIGAATLLAIWKLTGNLAPGAPTARGWALLLTVASPAFVVTSISYYSMAAHLLASTLFALLLLEPTRWRLILAGLVGSVALVLHNPLPHLLFALPWIAWLASSRETRRRLPLLILAYLPLVLVLGIGWVLLRFHVQAGAAAGPAVGGLEGGLQRLAGVAAAGFTAPNLAIALNRVVHLLKVAVWAVPGLVLLVPVGFWQLRGRAGARLLLASAVLTVIGYLFVPFDQGHGWGSRYFHSAWLVLPVFGAAALASAGTGRPAWVRAFACFTLLSLSFANALRFRQVDGFIREHLAQAPLPTVSDARAVTFIDIRSGYYTLDLVKNDAFARGAQLILVSHGREQDAQFVREHFPELELRRTLGKSSLWMAR
ncbi:hypothetical protein [Sphaerobacter sp.]|uniref:hypothetical protein n=1 Tax=Sphaerobacter sp. TaxID=2099654 RepID=UPI001DF2A47C|nr:hypothetical protein [Sphaerobacter sp.]MBX5446292.1 hypothetical protein [Sphaerobacter sp.]